MPDEKVLKTPRGLRQSVRHAVKQITKSLVDTAVHLGTAEETDPERLARQALTLTKALRETLALAESLTPSAEKAENADALRADLHSRLTRLLAAHRPDDLPETTETKRDPSP